MKLKKEQLWNSFPVLDKWRKIETSFKLAYRIQRIIAKVENVLKEIETERVRLVNIYADEQTADEIKTGKQKQVVSKIKFFLDCFNVVLQEEVEIDISKIPVDLLENNMKVSASDINVMECFIEENDG